MDKELAAELKQAEAAIVEAEKQFGPEAPELADKLQRYANLLKQNNRALDAVNVEARARAIRARVYADDEKAHGTGTISKPSLTQAAPAGLRNQLAMAMGFVAIFLALSTFFLPQSWMLILLPIALVLGIADAAIGRRGYWRVALTAVFAGAVWLCNQALPPNMLTEDKPIDRYNYATQNAELVNFAKQLAPATTVLNYSICLPPGFVQVSDDKKDWGRMISWQSSETKQEDRTPRLSLMLMRLPEDTGKKKGQNILSKLARDFAMPKVIEALDLGDIGQEPPHFEEINGMEFEKFTFPAAGPASVPGFAYIAISNGAMLVLAGDDAFTSTEDNLPRMEASVFTFKTIGNAPVLEPVPDSGPAPPPEDTTSGGDGQNTGTEGGETAPAPEGGPTSSQTTTTTESPAPDGQQSTSTSQ